MAKGYSLDALVQEHYGKFRTALYSTNLNTLTGMDAVGVYFQDATSLANQDIGYPAKEGGTLEVLPHGNWEVGRVMQRYTTFFSKRVFIRSQEGPLDTVAFGAWVEFINANNIYNAIYPIGIVLKFDNAVNPNNAFTGTVWEQIVDGRSARSATSAEAGTTAGQIGSTGGSDTASLAVANLPGHTHGMQNHTHGIAAHTHTMAHTHTINHDHGAVTSSSSGAHTHSVSGTAASNGAHTHTAGTGYTGAGNYIGAGTGTGLGTMTTNSAGAHTHSVSGTAESAGAHTHSVDLPNYTGTSGGSSAANTGGTALTTGGPSNNETTSTGSGTAFTVTNAVHYYAFWKRVA